MIKNNNTNESILYYKIEVPAAEAVEETVGFIAQDVLGIDVDVVAHEVWNRDDYVGGGYLFVSDPRLFHILLGRNADGSSRRHPVEVEDGGNEDDWATPIRYEEDERLVPETVAVTVDNDREELRFADPRVKPPPSGFYPNIIVTKILEGTDAEIRSIKRTMQKHIERITPQRQGLLNGRSVTFPLFSNPSDREFEVQFLDGSPDAALILNMVFVVSLETPQGPVNPEPYGSIELRFGNKRIPVSRGRGGRGRGGRGRGRGGRGGGRRGGRGGGRRR